MKREITYAEKYDPAMKITDQDAADAYFEECVAHTMSFGKNREEAEATERTNLGYWAGYYSHETRERVERLFRCEHPVFGKIAENGPPTPLSAYKSGLTLGAAAKDRADLAARAQLERDGIQVYQGAPVAVAAAAAAQPREHEPFCDADGAHPGDCKTAVRLARLTAFAEAVRDEVECTDEDGCAAAREDHVDDCWHCYAEQALGDM
jgi:hypothetical protein